MNKITRTLLMTVAGAAMLATQARAAFSYLDNDLLLNFRQTDGASTDPNLTVNLGNVLTFKGQSGTLNQFTPSQVTTLFGNFDNLAFSVVATEKDSASVTTPYVNNTLWLTLARSDINVQTTAPNSSSSLAQGGVATKIAGIGAGANAQTVDLTDTATVTLDNAGNSYHTFVGSGTFGGGLGFSVENTTGPGFTGFVRSDLYELIPSSGAATYLGYFEFSDTGTMGFVSANPVPEPSTYALIACAGLIFFAMQRKVRIQAVSTPR